MTDSATNLDANAVCDRVDALAEICVKALNEIIDVQATLNVTYDCLRTLMTEHDLSLKQSPNLDATRIRKRVDAECEDVRLIYRKEFSKRVQFLNISKDAVLNSQQQDH